MDTHPLILVVEDDPGVAETLEALLQAGGYATQIADGPGAAATAKEIHPDTVLLDLMLPDIRGEDVYQQLQADESTRDIPVMITSAVPAAALKAQRLGVDDILTKPFSMDLLLEKVGALVQKYHNRPQHA